MKQRISRQFGKTCSYLYWILYLAGLGAALAQGLETVFLQDSCTCSAIDQLRCESYILGPIQNGAGHVALSRSSEFPREFYCQLVIQAPRHQKVQIQINELAIPWTKHCRSGLLRIYDGVPDDGGWQIVELCGEAPTERIFRSASRIVTVFYSQREAILYRPKSFNLTFTYFHLTTGIGDSCNSSRHIQCQNGICISSYLRCDSYDHCGGLATYDGYTDEAGTARRGFSLDECSPHITPTTSPVTGVTLGVVVVSVVIIILLSIIIYSVRKKKGPFFQRPPSLTVMENGPTAAVAQGSGTGRRRSPVCEVAAEPSSDVLNQEDLSRHTPPPSYSELFPDK